MEFSKKGKKSEDETIFNKVREAVYAQLVTSPSFKVNSSIQGCLPKIGCEQELMLFNAAMAPCSMSESQEFFSILSNLRGWRVNQTNGDNQILRVSFDLNNGHYHSVKYEHPPHLIEFALAPAANLIEFRENIFEVWKDLHVAAEKCQKNILSIPFINHTNLDWIQIEKMDAKYIELAQSRERYVAIEKQKEPWVHFPTYMAASQFHIGGCNWLKNGPQFVDKLYRLELLMRENSYGLLSNEEKTQAEVFKRRWENYRLVFSKLELVGFPQFPAWTIDRWIQAFSKSSLILGDNHPLAWETLYSLLAKDIDYDIAPLISKVRDLQIIKPKLFGTLEFRADPALPSPDAIMSQAAIRFGAYLMCLDQKFEPFKDLSLLEVREIWGSFTRPNELRQEMDQIYDHIHATLGRRGLGEEKLM